MVYYSIEDAEELYNSEEFVILENLYVHKSGEYAVAIETDGDGVNVVEIESEEDSILREVFNSIVQKSEKKNDDDIIMSIINEYAKEI
jgi:hypothetical protein